MGTTRSSTREQKLPKIADIVSVGQTSLDTIFIDDNAPRVEIGGSGYIPARLWANWGLSVGLVSCLGSGLTVSQIATENLDLTGVKVWSDPASSIELHYSDQNLIQLDVRPGPSEKLSLSQIPGSYFESQFFYLSPAPIEFLLDLTQVTKRRGIPVALSPKEDFPSIADGRMNLLVSRCNICFLNERELHLLTDCDSMPTAIALLHSTGPQIIVVTKGRNGATVSTKGREFFTTKPSDELSIPNPVGAGDCFAASLLASLLANRSVQESAEYATATTVRWLRERSSANTFIGRRIHVAQDRVSRGTSFQ